VRRFAQLLDSLGNTQSRIRKLALLTQYLKSTPDPDRGWALAALTDGLPTSAIGKLRLRPMLAELTGRFIDPVLYKLSRDYVGDSAETVALLWPDVPPAQTARDSEVVPLGLNDVVQAMKTVPAALRTGTLGGFLDQLDVSGRWALLKLLGGAARVGVSARLAKTALAQAFDHQIGDIDEVWHGLEAPYVELFEWLEGRAGKPDTGAKPVFRPVMLAHPIEDVDWPKLKPEDFVAEWKWDGIRVQISARAGDVRIFSRQGDDVSTAFPDIATAFRDRDAVLDGELLVVRTSVLAPFNDLQQRLNRKAVSAKTLRDFPAHVRLYDLLIDGADDLRPLALTRRRARLEEWFARRPPPLTDLSALIAFSSFEELTRLWAATRDEGIEGLMLKRRDSAYQAGRVKGEWFKWKRAALTLDCVLMYAQRGSGKRSSFYSDYTFGVWTPTATDTLSLVPVGKAYSGFTDDELRKIDKWVREHTVETFGPVRSVAPGLVFEVAFDAVQASARHKSGVAMRFPRIHRIRWDKPAAEADTLATIKALVGHG
jgi:DNA ligase 1